MKIGKDKRKKNQTGGVVKLVASRNYRAWINDLRKRYRAAQTKAAVSVNSALLEFYWNLGKDISEKYAATQYYGSRFFECVSKDLTDSIRNPQGLSVVNIRYCQRFYDLYSSLPILPQLVEELVSVPWGQHRQRKSAPQKERSMDALTSSTDAGPIAAVVDSLLCGLVGKTVARQEENCKRLVGAEFDRAGAGCGLCDII